MKRFAVLSLLIFNFYIQNCFSQSSCMIIPDTVCVNNEVTPESGCAYNTQYWNFCGGEISETPVVLDRGTLSYMNSPVRITVALDNGVYYAFWTNFFNGNITKCVFGNSLKNIPVTYDLGNIGGLFTSLDEGIQLIHENGKWYAFLVGSGSKFFRIDFGTSLNNPSPTATSFGTIGNMNLPHGLYMFQENGKWMGLVANAQSNSFTRIVFPDSLTGVPVATNSGVVPGVNYPTSIYPVKENDSCYALVTSKGSNEIYRFNFGNSYMNSQMNITNLGNIGALNEPFDIAVIRDCDKSFGIISNKYHIAKVKMPGGVAGNYDGDTLYYGSLNRCEGISNAIRQGDSLYYLIVNAGNRLTVLGFGTCVGNIPNYNGQSTFSMNFPNTGTYSVSLTLNEGQYNQVSECKTITVVPEPVTPVLTLDQDTIFASPASNIIWYFNDQVIPNQHNAFITATAPGQYYAVNDNGYCLSDTSNNIIVSSVALNGYSTTSWNCYISGNILELSYAGLKSKWMKTEIIDITGKRMLSFENNIDYSSGTVQLLLKGVPSGLMFVRVNTQYESAIFKIIKSE